MHLTRVLLSRKIARMAWAWDGSGLLKASGFVGLLIASGSYPRSPIKSPNKGGMLEERPNYISPTRQK